MQKSPVILLYGDSLSAAYAMDETQGWGYLLACRLTIEGYAHRLVNVSVSGEVSWGGRYRLPIILAREKPSLMILALGANDGLCEMDLQHLYDNLATMIELAQAAGTEVLLLGMRLPSDYPAEYRAAFSDVYAELAEIYALPWLAFFLEGVAENPALLMPDGLHPAPNAQIRILDNVWPLLRTKLGPP